MDQVFYSLSLAVDKKVSPTTHQAFSAILFLYKEVLGVDMSNQNIQAFRAQERAYISVVLTREEVKYINQIANINNFHQTHILI